MANQRILYTEEAVGYGHPTKTDVVNRMIMVEHAEDGTHKLGTLGGFLFGTSGVISALSAANRTHLVAVTHNVSLTDTTVVTPNWPLAKGVVIANISGTTAYSIGFYSSTPDNICVYDDHQTGANTYTTTSSYCVYLRTAAGVASTGALTTSDATTFTITWTKAGSPTGTANLYFLTFR